jgi:hypothetical protein
VRAVGVRICDMVCCECCGRRNVRLVRQVQESVCDRISPVVWSYWLYAVTIVLCVVTVCRLCTGLLCIALCNQLLFLCRLHPAPLFADWQQQRAISCKFAVTCQVLWLCDIESVCVMNASPTIVWNQ